jgi:hypothetical protein
MPVRPSSAMREVTSSIGASLLMSHSFADFLNSAPAAVARSTNSFCWGVNEKSMAVLGSVEWVQFVR